MKITEKLYIDRLEKMVKRYKKKPCNHCPLQRRYTTLEKFIDEDTDDYDTPIFARHQCQICRRLVAKYNDLETTLLKSNQCPCNYFNYFFDFKRPEGYMLKVAWKTIKGWKKDNKKEEE